LSGTDLTRIDCIDVMTAMTVISEAGWDMSNWKTEDHFVSWLRLCPDNRISGDKIIGKGRLPTNNPVSIALKMAASSLRQSNTYIGAQFRRLRTRLGAPIAIKAMAAKLARVIYRMLRHGMKYVDQGAAFYEAQHRQVQIKQLKWKAAKLGFQIVQAPAAYCDACPPPAILGHENLETLPSVGARIPRIRLAGDPLYSDLCLGLLPTTSLIGM